MSNENQMVRGTFMVPHDVLEAVRNAAFWTPGLTMADVAERGLRAEIERLEAERGEKFPPRVKVHMGGRPIGS